MRSVTVERKRHPSSVFALSGLKLDLLAIASTE